MLLHIPHDHRYWLADGTHWEFYYVLLTGSEVLRLWRELLIRTGPLLELRPDGAARRLAEEACARVLDGTITSAFTSSALAYSLTMALLEESAPTWAEAQTPAFVTKVESYCRRHLARPIGVEDMARAAGMSRYHFSRRFREARGVSPGRYLAELRLREAVRLLQDKTLSIKEIAARSGYTDAGYLLKVFRKNFGMSTRRFREEGGASG
jgi:transcriptional regulator GlxA family with amidase domain